MPAQKTPLLPNPLVDAAGAYAQYVAIAEISSLAEMVHESPDDLEPRWYGAPPAGLVLNG